MSIRSLVGLILLFALVTGAVWVSQLNRDPVTLRLPGLAPMSAPLWVVLFLTLLAGVFVALVYSLALSSREALARWRQTRSDRDRAAGSKAFEAGVRALLRGDAAEALRQLDAAVSADGGNAEAWLLAGDAARQVGDLEGATERHLRAQGLAPDDWRCVESLALDAEAAGDPTRAIRYLRELQDGEGVDPVRTRRLRDLYIADEDWKAAIEAQRLLGTGETDSARTLNGLRVEEGYALLAQGDAAAAAARASAVIADAPAFEPAHRLLGEAEIAADEPEKALTAWEAGVRATGSVELLRRLANLYVDAEQPEDAIRVMREAGEHLVGDAKLAARILLGRLYYRLEMIDEAGTLFEALAGQVEDSPVANYYLAKVRHRRDETEAGYTLLKQTIRRGGYLDARYRCSECGAEHTSCVRQCPSCKAWGCLQMDLSREIEPTAEAVAPIV